MALNVKVGLIGVLDMLKFKNMAKVREQAIQAAPAKEIKGEFAINQNAKLLHPDYQKLVVSEVIGHDAAGAKTYVFRSAENKPLAYFRAGQYLSLKLQIGDSFVTRPYSISSSPKWATEGKVAITVRTNPGGFVADWLLENLKEGDTVIASAGEGQFYYENLRDAKNVVALAGGSGITPFLSMAYAIRDGIEDFNLTILFGSRTEETILFREELDAICAACPKVKVVHVLSHEEKEGFEHGFITGALIEKYAAGEEVSVFMCGPQAMYNFVDGELAKLGYDEKHVRHEIFGAVKEPWTLPGYPAEAKGQTFQLTVKQCGQVYVIPASADEPLLIAIERAGIAAPSLCRSGECGWCRSRMTAGQVFIPQKGDGRRYADVMYGYIHPCGSFPISDVELEVPGEYLN